MKSSIAAMAGLAASFLVTGPASAVDIRNADEVSYEIVIAEENREAESFQLLPGERETEVCGLRCTIRVKGVGSVDAEKDEVVVIRDGQISKVSKQL